MITVFNRKELLCTFDMKKQAEVRDILWKYDISYEVRVSDRADVFVGGRMTADDTLTVPEHQTESIQIHTGNDTEADPTEAGYRSNHTTMPSAGSGKIVLITVAGCPSHHGSGFTAEIIRRLTKSISPGVILNITISGIQSPAPHLNSPLR